MTNSQRALVAEDLTKIDVYSDPQFMPNGNAYAYVSTNVNDDNDYDAHLFFQRLDGSQPSQWTFNHAKDSQPRFSPDGKTIVFQSTRSGLPQLWILFTSGGEAKQVTTFKHGATQPHWSKDGKFIVFSASLDKDDDVTTQEEQSKEERQAEQDEKNKQPIIINRLKHKSDTIGFHDDKWSHLVLFDVENETFTQLTNDDANHTYEDISPDGNLLLFSANLNNDADYEMSNDLYTLNIHMLHTINILKSQVGFAWKCLIKTSRIQVYINIFKHALLSSLG